MKPLLFVGIVVFAAPLPRVSAQEALDLVPAKAVGALVINNPDGLKVKGDKLFMEAGIANPGLRPSQLVTLALQFLGVNAGFDGKGASAAIILPSPKGLPNLDELVIALPFTELDQMAGNFGFQKGELKPGKVTGAKAANNFGQFLLARGKHLFIGVKEQALKAAAEGKSVRQELPPEQVKSLRGADIFVHLGTKGWADEWRAGLKSARERVGKREDPAEQKIVDQFFDALGEMRFGIGGVRVERGLGVTFVPVFARDGTARQFLKTIAGGKGGSSLAGLPEGNVVFAQALRGSATGNAVVAKVLFDSLLRDFVETRNVLSTLDRPVAVGFLTEILNRLEGSRAALYLTADESRLGLFSFAAVLDTDDPVKFLADMKLLARIADGSGLDLRKNSTAPDRIDVEQLTRDLGDARFRVRESATLKLRLLGEPALVYLEKARASSDLEVSRRASRLREQILRSAALRRKDLLEQDWLRRLQPSFAFIPRVEKRGGHEVDVVRIKLSGTDKTAEKALQQVFGPEWDNVRLAVQGKKVMVFLGSDLGLFDTTLRNLAERKSGLAGAKILQRFQAMANPERRLELHLAMHKIARLIDPARADGGSRGTEGGELTSISVSLDPDRTQLDVWMPVAEFRVLGKRFPF